jgi:hypothetical protein
MKPTFTFLIFFLFIFTFAGAQSKYNRIYGLKKNYFQHTALFSSGNAVIYIDLDSLVGGLQLAADDSENEEFIKIKIKHTLDDIVILSKKSDTTNISSLIKDQEIIDIALAYFSECVLNKKANILDKRTNELVKKIIVRKAAHSSRSSHTYSYYYYFLPNDKKEFMHRIERNGSGVKFL